MNDINIIILKCVNIFPSPFQGLLFMTLHCVDGNTFLCILHCPQHSVLQCFVFEPFEYLQLAIFHVPGFVILGTQAVAVRHTVYVIMKETERIRS